MSEEENNHDFEDSAEDQDQLEDLYNEEEEGDDQDEPNHSDDHDHEDDEDEDHGGDDSGHVGGNAEKEGEEEEEDPQFAQNVNTFMEFTGSSDRNLARQYVLGTNNMEEACNLFLTGGPPPPVRNNHRQQQEHESPLLHQVFGQGNAGGSASFLAHLAGLRPNNGEEEDNEEEGSGRRQRRNFDAFFQDLNEGGDLPLSQLARSLLGGGGRGEVDAGGFADFLLNNHLSLFSNAATSSSSRIDEDEAIYDSNSVTEEDAKKRMELLSKGEAVSLIGHHLLRSSKQFDVYNKNNRLVSTLCQVLARGNLSTDFQVRILQLLELVLLIVTEGFDQAELKTRGWFLPPRRSSSGRRSRSQQRQSALQEEFSQVVETNDLQRLRQLYRRGELDTDAVEEGSSWLLVALKKPQASLETLAFLMNAVHCSKDSLEDELNTWDQEAARTLQVKALLLENSNAPMNKYEAHPLPTDLACKNAVDLRELTRGLFRFVANTKASVSLNRGLELLLYVVEHYVQKVADKYPWSDLVTALVQEEATSFQNFARAFVLVFVKHQEAFGSTLNVLARNGTLYRLDVPHPLANGQPARLMEWTNDWSALFDMTAFEFEQCDMASKINRSLSDSPSVLQLKAMDEKEEDTSSSLVQFRFQKRDREKKKSRQITLEDKLIECAQHVISNGVNSFAQISHQLTSEDTGVRLLLHPLSLRLHGVHQIIDLHLNALPMTNIKEIQRHVLRCGNISLSNPRYQAYCQDLVGKKLVLHLPQANELFLCTKFDVQFGVHRLRSLANKQQQHWRVLALVKFVVLERLFDADDEDEIQRHDALDADFLFPDSTIMDVVNAAVAEDGEKEDALQAVWWEGSPSFPQPGWRVGRVVTCADTDQQMSRVSFPFMRGLVVDEVLRVGSLCRVLEENGPLCTVEALLLSGEVSTSLGTTVSPTLLAKIADSALMDFSRPNVGAAVGALVGGKVMKGIVIADDGSSREPFTIQCEGGAEYRLSERFVMELLPEAVMEDVSPRRVVPLAIVAKANREHSFAVYLRPSAMGQTDFIGATDASHATPVAAVANKPLVVYRAGDIIEGQYLGKNRWYRGWIARVNFDDTLDVWFEDGDMERSVLREHVRHAGGGEGQTLEQPSEMPISFDFRKAFSVSIGKSLFDSLRREDAVLKHEYNFVTRGFEHQPSFYQSFSQSLERLGAGVFGQFQTFEQALYLFTRCKKVFADAGCRDQVFLRYEPHRKPPGIVLKEITNVFTRLASARNQQPATGEADKSVPKPGYRCVLKVGPDATFAPLMEVSKSTTQWISATVLARSSAHVSVVTDEGLFFRHVPLDHVQEAPVTPELSNQGDLTQQQQQQPPHTSPLRFRSPVRSPVAVSNSPLVSTPVELSRQFSVFGSSNSNLRHLAVEAHHAKQTAAPPLLLANEHNNVGPSFVVEFDKTRGGQTGGLKLVDMDEESSLFRMLFETIFNNEGFLLGNTLKARWNRVPLVLEWKVRIVFPQDSDEQQQQEQGEEAVADNETLFPPPAQAALSLLQTLFVRTSPPSHAQASSWVNPHLATRFQLALKDNLSVASRTLPRWMQTLPRQCSFLFSEKDRTNYLRSSTIGLSRSIAYLQEEVSGYQATKQEAAHVTLELANLLSEAHINAAKVERLTRAGDRLEDELREMVQTKFIGKLREDLVKVNPSKNLLGDAMKLMEQRVGERSELVVQFEGEHASGEGTTNAFYGAVAAELQRSKQAVQMWAEPRLATEQEYLNPVGGLFPQPLFPAVGKEAESANALRLTRFRFLGRLFAQAYLDKKQVPLPMAQEFFDLLKRSGSVSSQRIVHLIEGEEGGIVSALYALLLKKDTTSAQELESRLEDWALTFVDPSQPLLEIAVSSSSSASASSSISACLFSNNNTEISSVPGPQASFAALVEYAQDQLDRGGRSKQDIDQALEVAGHSKVGRFRVLKAVRIKTEDDEEEGDGHMNLHSRVNPLAELVSGGMKLPVQVSNVTQYCHLVLSHWTETGIDPQIQACRLGLQDMLGKLGTDTLLALFSSADLLRMFCGEAEVKWNEHDALLGFIVPKGEYSANSKEVKMLVECLKLMTMPERNQFLSFCTALPRVPLQGLPQIKVFPPTKSRVVALVIQVKESKSSASLPEKSTWFAPGDEIRTTEGHRAVVSVWESESFTLHLRDARSNNQEFTKGRVILRSNGGEFTIKHCVEQCEVVQCAPLLRPKATTCAMTLYLPTGYTNAKHMLEVFQCAFEDAKHGGLQDVQW